MTRTEMRKNLPRNMLLSVLALLPLLAFTEPAWAILGVWRRTAVRVAVVSTAATEGAAASANASKEAAATAQAQSAADASAAAAKQSAAAATQAAAAATAATAAHRQDAAAEAAGTAVALRPEAHQPERLRGGEAEDPQQRDELTAPSRRATFMGM